MARPDASVSLSALARLGFAELSDAATALAELESLLERPRAELLAGAVAWATARPVLEDDAPGD